MAPATFQTASMAGIANKTLAAPLVASQTSKGDKVEGVYWDLDLSKDDFTDPSTFQDLAKALRATSFPISLNVRGATLATSSGFCRLLKFLEGSDSAIELNISSNSLSCDLMDAQASQCLRQLLQRNSTILKLDLSGRSLDEARAADLAQGLQDNKTLRELKLVSCSLSESSARLLLNASAHSLQDIDLSSNGPFSPNFLNTDVAMYLKRNTCLRSLTLGHLTSMFALQSCGTELSSPVDAIRLFLQALRENTTLKNLSFRYCRISEAIGEALLQTLTVNHTLQRLDLEMTGFAVGGKGKEILLQLLPQMQGLRTLRLLTRYSEDMVPQLQAALQQNRSLESFRPGVGVSRGGRDRIQSLLMRNRHLNQARSVVDRMPPASVLPLSLSQWSQSKAGSSAIFQVLRQRIDECIH